MGNKALDLATTMVLRDTRPGKICPIPVNFEGVGGLKVVDHTDCEGCYFEGEDCPNIDANLTCNRSGKAVIYMPIPADEMGITVSGKLHVAEITDSPIDSIEEIDAATVRLMEANKALRLTKADFEAASNNYAQARLAWGVAWEAVAAFARSTKPESAPVVSVPFVQADPTPPMVPTITVTKTPYVSTNDSLDDTLYVRIRPKLKPSSHGTTSVEDKILESLDFDVAMTLTEVTERVGGKRSTVANGLSRLGGCGLVVAEKATFGHALKYRMSGASTAVPVPGSIEQKVFNCVQTHKSLNAAGIAAALKMPESSAQWIAAIMVRAGILVRNQGWYSVAKGE